MVWRQCKKFTGVTDILVQQTDMLRTSDKLNITTASQTKDTFTLPSVKGEMQISYFKPRTT